MDVAEVHVSAPSAANLDAVEGLRSLGNAQWTCLSPYLIGAEDRFGYHQRTAFLSALAAFRKKYVTTVEGALSATNLGCGIFLASPQLQADLVLPPRAGRAPLSVDSRSLLRERLINYVYVIELHRLGSRARFQLLRCKGSFPIGRCTSWIRAKMTEYIR